MFVVRRKPQEAVIIGGTITVRVLAVKGRRVHLGIEASPEVKIVLAERCSPPQTPSGDRGTPHGGCDVFC